MNSEDFKTIVEGCIANINSVLANKSREYSSKDNKLHNFDKAKDLMRCKTKEYALLGMLNKHLVSVIDMIVKYEQEGILPSAKLVNEKIGDSINYFVLLKACFMEDIYNKENDKISDYTVGDIRNIREQIKKTDEGNLCEFCANADRNCLIKENLGMKIAECKAFIDLKKQQAAMANSNNDKQDVETLKKKEALIANSLWNNARKRLVVENLRKMLKSLFVWLTDNNRFVDYEKIKGILNKAEFEADSVPDEFVKDVIVEIELLEISSVEWYRLRDQVITEVIQVMLQPKYKIGDTIWFIGLNLVSDKWEVVCSIIIEKYALYKDDKAICYKSVFCKMIHEKNCFKTNEEAQQECDNRNKSEQDIKDMFDTASDLTTAMVVNKRKKAVVDNMQDKLKPIIEYLQIVEPKQYQCFSNLCFQEIQKHNSITDKVFYKTTIDFLNSLMLPDTDKLPQYKFRTMKQIRDIIVKQLRDELEKM